MSYNKETGMYEGYIYVIINNINDKTYVGQTRTTIERRWYQHRKASETLKNKAVLYNAMRKYGVDNFSISIIGKYEQDTKEKLIEELNKKEMFYIALLDSTCDNYGYNMLAGGDATPGYLNEKPVYQFDMDGKLIQSFQSSRYVDKDLISSDYVCKICGTNSLFGNGYVWSYNDKLSASDLEELEKYKSMFEDKFNERFSSDVDHIDYKIKRKIYQFNLDCTFVREWDSKTSASLFYTNNKSSAALNPVFKGKNHQAFGYLWSYNKEVSVDYKTREELSSKKVRQYDLDFNYIQTFDSIRIAESKLGVCHCDSISNVCKGNYQQAFGFIWRFENDNEDNPMLYYEKQGYVRPIKQFDLLHNFIASYENMLNIENFKPMYIKWCCDGKTKKAYGYIWEYDTDVNTKSA